ncbi:hypothetical protein IWW37_001357 [Coemansia sp. RSA 2050]|nr:hypothetical protein IWW37_001357 [Coemansia sp. RSA 2050]KAJ2735842.1 hypothetical protein IW152_001314 [Coemansia sp. BCRC 34962]
MCARGPLSRGRRRVGGLVSRFLFDNQYLRDEYFATSYIIPQRPLLGVRIVVFVYCASVLISNLVANIKNDAGWSWAAYFTTLTYFGITLYYWFAAYNTGRCLLKHRHIPKESVAGRAISHPTPLPPDQLAMLASASSRVFGTPAAASRVGDSRRTELDRVRLLRLSAYGASDSQINSTSGESETVREISELGDISEMPGSEIDASAKRPEGPGLTTAHQLSLAAQWILYELFACYAPLVSIIYWSILYPSQGRMGSAADLWMGISMHGLNTVFMSLEVLVFARCPFRWTHVGVALGAMSLYLALAYLMVTWYGFYVYPFFEAKYFGVGGVALFCILILDIAAISWVVLLMVHHWRDRAYARKWPPVQCVLAAA